MNMFRAFMELDRLRESTSHIETKESYDDFGDRQELITKIKSLGRRYYFDKYSDRQLFFIWQKESAKEAAKRAERELFNNYQDEVLDTFEYDYCETCGRELNPLGECPTCDLGDDSAFEELDEGIFDQKPSSLTNWHAASSATARPQPLQHSTQSTAVAIPAKNTSTAQATGLNIVTIVYDDKAHKLRARADDGVHGEANVAFPNSLRNHEGQQYEVENLTWTGKNYRASGKIEAI